MDSTATHSISSPLPPFPARPPSPLPPTPTIPNTTPMTATAKLKDVRSVDALHFAFHPPSFFFSFLFFSFFFFFPTRLQANALGPLLPCL